MKRKVSNEIVEETQREAIINRPYNFFGSIKKTTKERFCISEDSIEFKEATVVPALVKIFMEAVDNPVDMAIKGACKKIDVFVTDEQIKVKDDGIGVSSGVDALGEYILFKAFCKYNTSSNYKEFKNQGQKGANGLGIKGANTLSSEFVVVSDDKKKKTTLISKENNLVHEITETKSSGKTGVEVSFIPDFNIFDTTNIDEEHKLRMFEYVLMQSLTYPEVAFTFNGKVLKYTAKKFVSLLNPSHIIEEHENYFFALLPNEFDDHKQLSYVNGLETSKGGTHVNYVVDIVVSKIREKLVKKYKTIKPGDIKNKLTFVLIAKEVTELDWEGQTKESISTPNKYWSEYFKDVDFDKLTQKILKTPEIIDPITEVYKLKEELKKRQELKKADKVIKKPQSEKFMPPIGKWENIFLCEGDCLEENTEVLLSDGNPIRIKDITVGDNVIALDGSIQKVISKTTSIRETYAIKSQGQEIKCSGEHRFYVYDKTRKEFVFVKAKELSLEPKRYSLLKSKINSDTIHYDVLDNDVANKILYIDGGEVKYTENDFFIVLRDEAYLRVYSSDIVAGDMIVSNVKSIRGVA